GSSEARSLRSLASIIPQGFANSWHFAASPCGEVRAMRGQRQDRGAHTEQLVLADDEGHDRERDDRGDGADHTAADRGEADPPAGQSEDPECRRDTEIATQPRRRSFPT